MGLIMTQGGCCFTGHRVISHSDTEQLRGRLVTEVENLISQGINIFYAGGAVGFDTIAAEEVLRLRERYMHIKLILALPCRDQTNGWRSKDIVRYERIKKMCDCIVYTGEQYSQGCMHKRNRYLVDNSEICIAYLKRKVGGTLYTVNYAEANNLKIINLAN